MPTSHLKRTIMGREVVCAITAGKLDFGPWEQIFYGEFDGKRRKARASEGDWGMRAVRRILRHVTSLAHS